NRSITVILTQVTGVHPVLLDRHIGLGRELLVAGIGFHGGPPACLVAVEGEDNLAVECIMVEHDPPEHPCMICSERGAAGGHGRIYPGEMTGHHVGISFDDDCLAAR